MAAAVEVQNLLRFLSQDAKVPLSAALPKVGELRKANLNSAESISRTDQPTLQRIFPDGKLAKQILSAAKRVSNPKKRSASSLTASSPSAKRGRGSYGDGGSGCETGTETRLALPTTGAPEDELLKTTVQTNRAPLVLAFAVTLLKYTMPEQPLSSRLSLAQAVVSANSQSKARSIGLETSKSAEEEGWSKGQPKATVMGRAIAVMRRAEYPMSPVASTGGSQATVEDEEAQRSQNETAFWGLDLEALRKSNGPLVAATRTTGRPGLPIHTPEAARSYLLRSFTVVDGEARNESAKMAAESPPAAPKPTSAQLAATKEEAAARVLKALDLLYESWASSLSKDDLDRRAWSFYLHVRPDVAQGQAGWGQKGIVKLEDILKLRRSL